MASTEGGDVPKWATAAGHDEVRECDEGIAAQVPSIHDAEESVEQTAQQSVDDLQGGAADIPPPKTPRAGVPPADAMPLARASSLPLAVPGSVEIREVRDVADEETEVRTLVTSLPPDDVRAAVAAGPGPAVTSVDTDSSPDSSERQPLIKVTPSGSFLPKGKRKKDRRIPDLDEKEDDAYESDESVTMRGKPIPEKRAAPSNGPPSNGPPSEDEGTARRDRYREPVAEEADSVTTQAPLVDAVPRLMSPEEQASEDVGENKTAVMAGSPYAPNAPSGPAPSAVPLASAIPNAGSISGAAVWVQSTRPRGDSDSGLGLAKPDGQPRVDRASAGALATAGGPPATQSVADPYARTVEGSLFPSGPYMQADSRGAQSVQSPLFARAVQGTPAPTSSTKRYAFIVALAALVCVTIPLGLYFTLSKGGAAPSPRQPAEVEPDPVGIVSGSRDRAKPPPPAPPSTSSRTPPSRPFGPKKR